MNKPYQQGLTRILNAAAELESHEQRRQDAENDAQELLAKDISALPSYQKFAAEVMPYLQAYLYAGRMTRQIQTPKGKEFDVRADLENDVTGFALRLSQGDYFCFSVCDEGYFEFKRTGTPQFLSDANLNKPQGEYTYLQATDILDKIGHAIQKLHTPAYRTGGQDKNFEKYFAESLQKRDTGDLFNAELAPQPRYKTRHLSFKSARL